MKKRNEVIDDVKELIMRNGAWLIRNSWGDDTETHDHGYFWCSYEQQADFAAFIVDKADEKLACYQWDYLGWCTEIGYDSSDAYAINVFKAGKYVNTAYGTVKPTAKTVGLGERKGSYNFKDDLRQSAHPYERLHKSICRTDNRSSD